MDPTDPLLARTRRHFFRDCGVGVGTLALASMLARDGAAADGSPARGAVPTLHHPAKAKSIIFLFMAGAPSQFELFEPKPELQKLHGEPIPDSFTKGRRFAFMNTFSKDKPKLLGTKRAFKKYGDAGLEVSDLMPHFGKIVDDVTFVRTMATDVFNHAPAKLFMNGGSQQFGRPSMGSWLTYGLGSECQDLPGFVVLQSGPRGPRGGVQNWGSGFLPSAYQGVPFRSTGDPVVSLGSPPGVTPARQRDTLDLLGDLNRLRQDETKDPETLSRIASYEMAFRMQSSAPDLIDLSKETKETLALYGAEPGKPSYANNCLLARRLVERGVRFIQLYHTDWDHHGDKNLHLGEPLEKICQQVDRASAALVLDLKQRGLLDDTLVVWGGEFGRTPMGEIRELVGRNHHIDAFPMWLAGGGVKKGYVHGSTDEFGFAATDGKVHVHDLQATILHQFGLDHEKLTYRFQGRNFRLTDVAGEVVRPLLS